MTVSCGLSSGDLVGTRTQDPQLRRLLLYPAELRDQPIYTRKREKQFPFLRDNSFQSSAYIAKRAQSYAFFWKQRAPKEDFFTDVPFEGGR